MASNTTSDVDRAVAEAAVDLSAYQSQQTHDDLQAIARAEPTIDLVVTEGGSSGKTEEAGEASEGTPSEPTIAHLRAVVASIVKDFLSSGNATEALKSLAELKKPYFLHEFVKQLCIGAIDADSVVLAANLLDRAVHVGTLLANVLRAGMHRVLSATDDLALDVPHAPKLVAHLVQHLVHGSVLSSDFFDTLPEDVAAAMAEGGAARKAAALYKSDHVGCDDTDEVGGAGAVAPVDALKHAVFTIANEYLKDGLGEAAEAQVVRLNCPHYMHELVLRVFVLSMERGTRESALASELVDRLHRHGVVERGVIKQGFTRLVQRCDDLGLDVPRAPAFVAEAVAQAVSDDALDADFFDTIPESVTAELKPEGPALFAKSLYEMYGSDVAKRHELSAEHRP